MKIIYATTETCKECPQSVSPVFLDWIETENTEEIGEPYYECPVCGCQFDAFGARKENV